MSCMEIDECFVKKVQNAIFDFYMGQQKAKSKK